MELDGALRELHTIIAGIWVAFFQECQECQPESRGQVENGDNKMQLCEDPCCDDYHGPRTSQATRKRVPAAEQHGQSKILNMRLVGAAGSMVSS